MVRLRSAPAAEATEKAPERPRLCRLGPQPLVACRQPAGPVSRPASAAPATGSSKRHAREQKDLIERVLS